MRVCVIVTDDGQSPVPTPNLQGDSDPTKQIFKDEAKVIVYADVDSEGRVQTLMAECDFGACSRLGLPGHTSHNLSRR
jgi:hypothetical protein